MMMMTNNTNMKRLLFLLAAAIPLAGAAQSYLPQLHGIIRGKYEYQPQMSASRFEVRNARISVDGRLPLRSSYKLEIDLSDEGKIVMKDAWAGINPWSTLQITVGQQRLPFTIDAHRNPQAQYFANRSFIAKQVGDVRDVGVLLGYTFRRATLQGGLFNGSNMENEKTAWHRDWNFSARAMLFPVGGLCLSGSVQRTGSKGNRDVHYTSFDGGAYYERKGWHVEAEYLHKRYDHSQFAVCHSVDAMVVYRQSIKREKCFLDGINYMGRYDFMGDHSDGTKAMTDALRHRMTLGLTFDVRNKYFPTALRLNYEKYWYPHGGYKESERDKIVAEVALKF